MVQEIIKTSNRQQNEIFIFIPGFSLMIHGDMDAEYKTRKQLPAGTNGSPYATYPIILQNLKNRFMFHISTWEHEPTSKIETKLGLAWYMEGHLVPTQFASTFRFLFTAPNLQKVDTVFNKLPFITRIT